MLSRLILFIFSLCCSSLQLHAQWKHVQKLSVNFTIKNAGIMVEGSFTKVGADIVIDETDPSKSAFAGTVQATSIRTGITLRDNHLKDKSEFFNVKQFPSLTMKALSIVKTSESTYTVTWELMMKGITKKINTEVKFMKSAGLMMLSTDFKIKRRDWQIGSNSLTMSDWVNVSLRAVLDK